MSIFGLLGVYMDDRDGVITNIPVRKGLEERYSVHINVASIYPVNSF